MTTHPINLHPHEVRALLDRRLTQIRRPCCLPKSNYKPSGYGVSTWPEDKGKWGVEFHDGAHEAKFYPSPFGAVGDVLIGREAIKRGFMTEEIAVYAIDETFVFQRLSDNPNVPAYYQRCYVPWEWNKNKLSASQMPLDASRWPLVVTEVRVERVQEISANDAVAGGVTKSSFWKPKDVEGRPFEEKWWDDYYFWNNYPQIAYRNLWDSLYGKRYPWSANPWAFVYEIKEPDR